MRARTLHGLIALVVVVTTLGCEEPPPAIDEVILTLRSASPLVTLPAVEPSRLAPEARALGPRRFVLPRRAMPHEITLDGFCPVTPSVTEGPVLDVALTPLVELVAPAPVGHDAAFTVEVRPGCREALAGSVTWQLLDGASTPLTIERRGFVVRGRTAPWDPPSAPRWGIVPVSAARAAAITLAMHYTRPDQPPIVREVIVLAEARATGVPSVPLGAGVLLRGGPFRVVERPRGSQSAPLPIDHELERLVPDASGRWVLEDASGRPLSLRSGEHVATPLDCGRGPCHARETELVLASPMTSSLARRSGEPCALRCHAVGEPGLPDGGFAHVALRVGWPTGVRGEVMPRALRRLAGVGCTACHGPGAIPEASARWAILRTDVCASCHDAPPRYGHVAAWASTRMATSDRAPETREPGCADCHTTAGFLAAIGARAATSVPEEAGPIGIGCAACHAPHAEARLPRALVRRVPVAESLGPLPSAWRDATSTLCLACHTPRDGAPGSSAAAMVLGVGGRDASGAPLTADPHDAPHASLTCLDCHGTSSAVAGLERGGAHAFAIDRERCARCHDAAMLDRAYTSASILRDAARARALALGLDLTPPHPVASSDAPASWNAALVLGDPGAWAHAPAYAARLLQPEPAP